MNKLRVLTLTALLLAGMKSITCWTSLCLLVFLRICPSVAIAHGAANVVSNASFECQGTWTSNSDGFSLVKEGRDGSMSLRFVAHAPATTSRKFSQPISLKPGRLYKASAWMKTADVKGDGTAPTITIEYFNKGKPVTDRPMWFIETKYSVFSGLPDTGNWRELTDSHMTTPTSFDYAVLSCYVGAARTGSVWWDDISLTPLPVPLMQSCLLEPNYRGWMYGEWPAALSVRLFLAYQENALKKEDLRLRALFTTADGKELFDSSREVDQSDIDWSIRKPDNLQAGKYALQLSLLEKWNGRVLARSEHALVQWRGEAPDAKCWIDRYQRLIVSGKPFFPIRMFAEFPGGEDLQRIADAGFNCLMPYFLYGQIGQSIEIEKKYLEDSERLGIKTIYSTKDIYEGPRIASLERLHGWKGKEAILRGLVETHRGSPNIIAWYINDEKGLADVGKIADHYKITRSLDENRPIWMVDYKSEVMRYFWDTSDVFGLDWYPIAWQPIDSVWKASAQARDQLLCARPRWDAPQAHNPQIYYPSATTARPPTLEEMRNMSYQFLCSGANGLVLYCYDDLKRDPKATFDERWRDVKKVAAEFKEISPILLSVEQPLPIKVQGGPEVHWFQKAYHNVTHVFLVNSGRAPVTAGLTLPKPGLQVKVDGVARGVSSPSGSIPLIALPAIGVYHVEIKH